jgi:hypothetical protein
LLQLTGLRGRRVFGVEEVGVTMVVKNINLAVVSQARKFVWGVDHGQLPFVQKRMSTVPDKPIITDEQKQQAINAAAGR